MASVVVRGLDDAVKQQRTALARAHGRSMEAEARDIDRFRTPDPMVNLIVCPHGLVV